MIQNKSFYYSTTFLLVVNLVSSNTFASEEIDEAKLVTKAVQTMEQCLHWGGEVGDNSPERSQQIFEGATKDCAEAKIYTEKAYRKYPNNDILSSQMIRYSTEGHFQLTNLEFKSLCSNTAFFFKSHTKAQFPMRHWYYNHKCLKQKEY